MCVVKVPDSFTQQTSSSVPPTSLACSSVLGETSAVQTAGGTEQSLSKNSYSQMDVTDDADMPVIPYPASLPQFSPPVADVLKAGVKSQVMLIYTEIVKESMLFYMNKLPTDTARAKLSLANIGRTVIERYPVLAVSDRQQPWSYFNEKLSMYLRNARNRIKHKLSSRPVKVAKLAVPHVASEQLSDEQYEEHITNVKLEMSKKEPNIDHLKELAHATYVRRRSWIDSTPSHDLRLTGVLDKFPCFKLPDLLLQELSLMKGEEKVSGFEGAILFLLSNSLHSSNCCVVLHTVHQYWKDLTN